MSHYDNAIWAINQKSYVKNMLRIHPLCLHKVIVRNIIKATFCGSHNFCFTGWGAYEPGGVDRAETLQEVQMPTVNYSICSKGNSHFQSVDNESMLCAGFGGNSTVSGCNGDSGGPLSCPEGGKFVLRGAASWGIPKCPAGNTYSVFARISAFVDWIENRVNNSVECSCAVKGVEWAFAHRLKIILMLGLAYLFKY